MAVSIVVEDGSGLTNSNSYVSVANCRVYAANRGVTLDASADVVGSQLITATDYLESFRKRYKGARVTTTQALSWPRKGAQLYDDVAFQNLVWFPDDEIPTELIAAQCQCVIEQAANGIVLQQSTMGPFVTRETVGPITTTFSEKIGTLQQAQMPAVNALLDPLLNLSGPLMNYRG